MATNTVTTKIYSLSLSYVHTLTTAWDAKSKRILGGVGSGELTVSAGDTVATSQLLKDRIVHCTQVDPIGGETIVVACFRIQKIKSQFKRGVRTLVYSGPDMGRELARRSCGTAVIGDLVQVSPDYLTFHDPDADPGEEDTDLPLARDGNAGTTETFTLTTGTYLYIGHNAPFSSATFNISTGNTNTAINTVHVQYLTDVGWVPPEPYTDTTVGFQHSGTVTWTTPTNWRKEDGEYRVRLYALADMTAVTLVDATIPEYQPTLDDVTDIMALAPSGWTLDIPAPPANTYTGTENGTYIPLAQESVLQALRLCAEQSGEQFVTAVDPTGPVRKAIWMRGWGEQWTENLGWLRVPISEADKLNHELGIVISYEHTSDDKEIISRIEGRGAGSGNGRLSLSVIPSADRPTPPTGYLVDWDASTIINSDLESISGNRTDAYKQFGNIRPTNDSGESLKAAGLALYYTMLAYLQARAEAAEIYTVTALLHQNWNPGGKLTLKYDREGVDEDLVLLEHEVAVDKNGKRTHKLKMSNKWHALPSGTDSAALATVTQGQATAQRHNDVVTLTRMADAGDGGGGISATDLANAIAAAIEAHTGVDNAHQEMASAGDGLEMVGAAIAQLIAVKLPSISGLAADVSGLVVDLLTDSGLALTANGLALGTPSSVTAASSNAISGANHAHAVTATSDGDANPSTLLESGSAGELKVTDLEAETAVTTPQLKSADSTELEVAAGDDNVVTQDIFRHHDWVSGSGPTVPGGPGAMINFGNGNADFRALTADEMYIDALIVAAARAMNGAWSLTKSSGEIQQSFVCPAAGQTVDVIVKDYIEGIAGFEVGSTVLIPMYPDGTNVYP